MACAIAYKFKGKRFHCGGAEGYIDATNFAPEPVQDRQGLLRSALSPSHLRVASVVLGNRHCFRARPQPAGHNVGILQSPAGRVAQAK